MENPKKKIALRSEDVNDILNKVPSKLIRWGSTLFLTLIVLIIGLSWFIKYPDVITAQAYLTTDRPPQKIYAKVDAKIDTILVSDKMYISENTILAILENNADNQDVLLLKSILDTILINQDHIIFPFEHLPILFLGDMETQFSAFENHYFQYVMNRDFQPFNNKIQANKSSIVELSNRLDNIRIQYNINSKELDIIKNDLSRNKTLLQKGIIAQQTYESKEITYYAALRENENLKLLISQLKETLNNAKSSSKGIGFDKFQGENQLLKQVFHSYRQLKRAVRDWELDYVLKSKSSGTLSFLEFWNTNQTVAKGDLVFTISPNDIPYYIAKVKTPKTNAGKIKIGQRVNLRLNDYPEYEFGVLRGSVHQISNTSDDGGTYIVEVKISKGLKTSFDKQIEFKQEMQGTADIITEDLRLLERFFYQFRSLYSK
ncbi:HlyD family secretion protein [Yeosuana sp. AK3]